MWACGIKGPLKRQEIFRTLLEAIQNLRVSAGAASSSKRLPGDGVELERRSLDDADRRISSFREAQFGLELREKPKKTRVAGRTAKPHNAVKQQLAIKLRAGRQVKFFHCDSVLAGPPAPQRTHRKM